MALGELDSCPVCIVVLGTTKISSPARNASNFKATLSYKHQVSLGWLPYTQLVIKVLNKVSSSFGRVLGGGEEGMRESNCREYCGTFNIGKFCQDLFPDNARIRSCTMTSDGDYSPKLFGVSSQLSGGEATDPWQWVREEQFGE